MRWIKDWWDRCHREHVWSEEIVFEGSEGIKAGIRFKTMGRCFKVCRQCGETSTIHRKYCRAVTKKESPALAQYATELMKRDRSTPPGPPPAVVPFSRG